MIKVSEEMNLISISFSIIRWELSLFRLILAEIKNDQSWSCRDVWIQWRRNLQIHLVKRKFLLRSEWIVWYKTCENDFLLLFCWHVNFLFCFLGNYVISNFLKSYISSSRDRLLSCPSLTITLQIRPMCDACASDDLRLIKVRNGNTSVDEPCFTYQWIIDDFNTKTKLCYEDECLESSIFTFEHKLDRHFVHLNNAFQLSLNLERDQNAILMLYHLTVRLKKHLPYKFRIEFFVRANFSTRLLKMSDILDSIDEYVFDPFTSKDLSDCTQQYNSSPCLVFFLRIVLYGDVEHSKTRKSNEKNLRRNQRFSFSSTFIFRIEQNKFFFDRRTFS